MGNCWSGFVAELQKIRRPIDYIERTHRARAARYNVRDRGDGIEFDNLLSEDEYEIKTKPNNRKVLTDEECTFINQRRYDDLVQKQKAVNAQIDEKLQKHEENLRLEEEEFYAAKREAARVARQEKAKQQKSGKVNPSDDKIRQILDDSAFASWLSDDEEDDDDHDLDTQEFEEFLAKVKQTTYSGSTAEDPSASGRKEVTDGVILEDALARNVEATKLAEQSLDALERWSPTFDDDD